MSDLNPFAKRLVNMVREMPDELLLELVRDRLASAGDSDATSSNLRTSSVRASNAPTSKVPKGKRGAKKRRRGGKSRAALEAEVLAVVNAGAGVALADVAEAVEASKPRLSAVLRSLREAGAIHAAGDRRFTRYGRTKAIATAASKRARKG